MKKTIYLSAIAALALVGCTNDDNIVQTPEQISSEGISFRTTTKKITRANEHKGADAAAMLGNNFVVEGWKTKTSASSVWNTSNSSIVFDNYNVNWAANTAQTTESNTADWEYVNQTIATGLTGVSTQEIKYWDHSALQYDFYAYSLGNVAGTKATVTQETPGTATTTTAATSEQATANARAYVSGKGGAYTLTGTKAQIGNAYISDLVTVAKGDFNKEVLLKFRALAAKVRIAFYETIPGYSVRDLEFYADGTTTTTVTDNKVTLYSGETTIFSAGTYTIYFPTVDSNTPTTDKNKAHAVFAPDGSSGSSSVASFNALSYQRDQGSTLETGGKYLGISSPTATYTNANKDLAYETVLPNESATALMLRCNYTLVSNDGSGETIKVWGATAVVPAIYCQWKSNYAYTYIFKISDNTNGTTEALGGSPSGLHPITFDAVAIDSEDGIQETVTTVATPSITTYETGVNPTANDEYKPGTIYVMVQDGATLKNDLGSKGQLYTVTSAGIGITEATVHDALTIGAGGSGNPSRNGITLATASSDATITAIPGADGNNITVTAGTAASFTAAASTTYAYVYETTTGTPVTTYTNTAVTLTGDDAPSDFTTAYYSDFACTIPCAAGDYKNGGTYYQKVSNTNRTYAVKVIKVVAAGAKGM